MSEPKGKARRLVEVVPGVHHWSVADDRLGGSHSDAYAVVDDDGAVVLIDPLPIDEAKLRELGDITAILLTAGNHQRSAWRFRKAFGAPVWAPENAYGLESEPDYTYVAGDTLPGGLMPFHTPGPAIAMYTLWMQRHPRGVAFISDLLIHDDKGTPKFVPNEYQDAPLRTRQSVQRILDHLTVDTVCFAHGEPIVSNGAAALRRALEEEREAPGAPSP
ncbi:MBL fold metallo-hydrolase [Myxococcus stipitatus]|uniref:MBL fold metallo-hydrolase n=1 Tax=Myxococcus stipitatus TaxID=83455 RepID=UPI001F3718A5|nr:MBL fold metallo-hydrolase [Myxococcus stipitatus]MCE9670950.1 MBL fold metallo-hydrolase [Myxococcus stipitatus]